MPKMKNMATEGRNGPPIALSKGMHLTHTQPIGGTSQPKAETLFENIKKQQVSGHKGRQHPGGGLNTKDGYDVATRVNVPSEKGMGHRSRTQRKMKGSG